MIAIILVGVFGGIKLDEIVKWEFPVFTLVLTLVSVVASMYYAVKDLIRFKDYKIHESIKKYALKLFLINIDHTGAC